MTVPQQNSRLRPQEQQNTWTVQIGWQKQFTDKKHEPSIYRMYVATVPVPVAARSKA